MRTDAIGRHVWLALVLAILAALISSEGGAGQLFALLSADVMEETAELAGAIGTEFPQMGVPP